MVYETLDIESMLDRDEPNWCVDCKQIDIYVEAITTADSDDLCGDCIKERRRFLEGGYANK